MAQILKGKDKGKIIKLHQWCNDWFTVKDSNKIYSPTSIRLDADEIREFLLSDSGHMLSWYELIIPDGIFKKNRRGRHLIKPKGFAIDVESPSLRKI